ncbi:hypothetical protein, partial [Prosthecobacter sp.]|uniref:hypothetical protein n=1 Tax=Prosthecobacter sp. TaxID=1965333 RepID=UPI0037C60A47
FQSAAGRLHTASVATGKTSEARALWDETVKSDREAMEPRVSAECCGLEVRAPGRFGLRRSIPR